MTIGRSFGGYALIVIAPALALHFVEIARPVLDPLLGTPFLAATSLVSRFVGFRAAVAATLLSVLLLDFFVLPPVLSLAFTLSGQTLPRLVLFVVVAIVTAGLASRSRVE